MDRPNRRGRLQNRPRPGPLSKPPAGNRRRMRIETRRNRRFVPRRNRLERAQNNQNGIGRPRNRRFRRFNFSGRRRNFGLRILYVGGLPRRINNRQLFNLFRGEGRIGSYRVVKDRAGYSRGFGFVEFQRPRDALRAVQKWNNTTLDRNIIKVQFRRRRNFLPRRNNFNNGRFNQRGRGFGFRGGRGGFRGGFGGQRRRF